MFSKFAAALLASFVAAKGDDSGINRENAMTYEVELDVLYNINLHLYNARVLNEDGTYTYELHGDFGIDAENLKRRFMYGFCLRRDIRENEPNADGIRDNI